MAPKEQKPLKLKEADKGLTKKGTNKVTKKDPAKRWKGSKIVFSEGSIKTDVVKTHKDALVPYLAMGFMPVNTSAVGLRCGVNALWTSYNAANRALGIGPARPLLQREVHALFDSEEFSDFVAQYLATQRAYNFLTDEQVVQNQADFTSKQYLSLEQITVFLNLLNSLHRTDYQLGYVQQGFILDGVVNDTQVGVMPFGEIADRPVLWIWQDNAVNALQSKSAVQLVNHWEGFGIVDTGNAAATRARRDRVANWGFGADVEADVRRGVWILREDVDGEGFPDMLTASAGSFLRITPAPAGVTAIDGMIYVIHSNGVDVGLVALSSLQIIDELHNRAPTRATDPDWVATEASKVLKPEKKVPKQEIPQSSKPNFQINKNEGILTEVVFYRTVEITDKLGAIPNTIDNDVKYIDGYTYNNGDFLLMTRPNVSNVTGVVNIEGRQGNVRERCLQSLLNPWGLPNQLPVVQNSLANQQNKRTRYLNMFRLRQGHEAQTVNKLGTLMSGGNKILYQKGEIVRADIVTVRGNVFITDFEGYRATISVDLLERIDRPWNLCLAIALMAADGYGPDAAEGQPINIVADSEAQKGVKKGGKRPGPFHDNDNENYGDSPSNKPETTKKEKALKPSVAENKKNSSKVQVPSPQSSGSEADVPAAPPTPPKKTLKKPAKKLVEKTTRNIIKKTITRSRNNNSKILSRPSSSEESSSQDDILVALPTPKKTPRKKTTKTTKKTIKKNTIQKNAKNSGKKILCQVTSSEESSSEDELSTAPHTLPKKTKKSNK